MKNFQLNKNSKNLILTLFAILFCFTSNSFAGGTEAKSSKSYFTSQSAIPLKKGEGYYQNTLLIHNSITYAIANGLDVSGNLLITPNSYPLQFKIGASLNTRFAHSIKDNIHFSGNLNIIVLDGIQFNPIIRATFGNRQKNITAGLGFLPTNENLGNKYEPIYDFNPKTYFEISGKYQVNNKLSVISENRLTTKNFTNTEYDTYYSNSSALNTIGSRIEFDKNNIDLGFSYSATIRDKKISSLRSISPYVSYAFEFGGK